VELAKNAIDVGIYTNQRDEQLAFWQQEVDLPFEELLKVGGGLHQLRHNLNGSVFKLNHTRHPLAPGQAGYHELIIARDDISEAQALMDPDGNHVRLVPTGWQGVTQIGMVLKVSDLEKFRSFYRDVLQIEQLQENQFRWGASVFFIEQADTPIQGSNPGGASGFQYLTVQVWKVDDEHQAFVQRGGVEAQAPRTLGQTARISFIQDPDGNWIEISQRASLTGSLA
jgi:lactoylglutathione lyase